MIYDDNSLSIGRTPMVRLGRLANGLDCEIFGKIEGRNPAYSVKCRIGASMIWDAEKRGILKPGKELIEPTSGNTGIALAFVAAARGYPITLTMPETMSIERRKVLKAFGAKLLLTEGALGMKGAITAAEQAAAAEPNRFVLLQQFKNPANPEIHVKTTGPEIWEDMEGRVDVLVSGVGTGGTISGVSRYIKHVKGQKLLSVGVEPSASPVITQTLANKRPSRGRTRSRALAPDSSQTLSISPWWTVSRWSATRKRSTWRAACPARKESCPASPVGPPRPSHCGSRGNRVWLESEWW